ncbi:hypothetical protein DL769_000046 [Monosporascus sp. CRB-8-3]|nr:hypothetical protein DL769_000046 [Monosporascus sp. CRB-8-3]
MNRAEKSTPQGSQGYVWRRACVACTKSKRQCTKQTPSCRRCSDRGIPCKYVPARPAIGDSANAGRDGILPAGVSSTNTPSTDDAIADPAFPLLTLMQAGIEEPSLPQESSLPYSTVIVLTNSTWFHFPESWIVDHCLTPDLPSSYVETSINCFIDYVQKWHRQWVTEGQSPLHHHRLYRYFKKMPRCVQDAYTAMTMYVAKNSKTEDITRQIIDDRVTQLLQEQAIETSLGSLLNLFAHLSRVHALLTYQVIRLFDGDIRMRAQAEALIPTLRLWANEMWEEAKRTSAEGRSFLSWDEFECDISTATWRTWIIVESVRRTWITACYIQNIYMHLKQGWSECSGNIAFTMRKGLWDLQSAYAWSRACESYNALFLLPSQSEKFFTETLPSDVDDFSHAVLTITHGLERMERWREDTTGKTPSLLSSTDVSTVGLLP